MNKNVLLVLVVILVPIVIMGAIAVNGAKNFVEQEHEDEEHESEETNAGHVISFPSFSVDAPASIAAPGPAYALG